MLGRGAAPGERLVHRGRTAQSDQTIRSLTCKPIHSGESACKQARAVDRCKIRYLRRKMVALRK